MKYRRLAACPKALKYELRSSNMHEMKSRKPWHALSIGVVVATLPVMLSSCANPNVFANCKALNAKYPHGVGLVGAVDHKLSGKPVTNFYRSNAIYNLNRARDADHDGIACER